MRKDYRMRKGNRMENQTPVGHELGRDDRRSQASSLMQFL